MLLDAIRVVQNMQLVCFAVVFSCMVLQDRTDRCLRWLLYNYLIGTAGALAGLRALDLPVWVVNLAALEVAQARYACLHLAVVWFVGRGELTRWLCFAMAAVCFALYFVAARLGSLTWAFAALDIALAVQTAWTACLLFRCDEEMTRWPRRMMGVFLSIYSALEMARLLVVVHTGHDPRDAAPRLESLSVAVYVVASSFTPLAFIWMLNSRLLGNLKLQSVTDPLTGILNRRGFEDRWMQIFDSYRATGRNFALAVADIDHFKRINDTYGHAQGDIVLRGVASLLRTLLREHDLAGRLGGEEFVLVIDQVDRHEASLLIEDLRAALEE